PARAARRGEHRLRGGPEREAPRARKEVRAGATRSASARKRSSGGTNLKAAMPPVDVAVAVLRRHGDPKILTRRRRQDEKLPGLWEFPGGKIEKGETPRQAAAREVREEMGAAPKGLTLLRIHEHAYPDRTVRIHVFEGTFEAEPAPP